MDNKAGARRSAVARLLLLLILALGGVHLLAHVDTPVGGAGEPSTHMRPTGLEQTAPESEVPSTPVAAAENSDTGTAGLDVCAAVICCGALLLAGNRWLRGRSVGVLGPVTRRWVWTFDPRLYPRGTQVTGVARSVVLRI
ncbi:hypothetical protein ACLIYP_00230 [Streptomyces nanhaiensis]|uniref:hypothetical protein n=1 Tax=Streptomyces nanhaiensis TaxID=679319 RepID=UPI00399D2C1A